jgi:hypothetical protein
MSLLFDISPTDEPQKKKSKKATAKNVVATEEDKATFVPAVRRSVSFLGRLDGDVVCLDQNCQGACHDVTDKCRDQWRIECCYCGTGQWIDAREEPEPEQETTGEHKAFAFSSGRFQGMGIAEAAGQPRWREYCEYAAKNHKDSAAREACQTWLAQNPASC